MTRAIGILLRAGVIAAAVVVLTAGAWYFAHAGDTAPDYGVFHGQPAPLRSARGVLGAAFHGDALAWMQLGLLILIATPVMRVIYSAVAYALQRDWVYVAITLAVLIAIAGASLA